MNKPSIFKRFDIRGAYPSEINPDVVTKIINIYINMFKPKEVVVGHDAVDGANVIAETICKTLADNGVNVTMLGLVTSPRLCFASADLNIQHAMMVTASHFGIGFTGIKFLIDGIPTTAEQISHLAEIYATNQDVSVLSNSKGTITNKDISEPYINKILELTGSFNNRYKIVIDSGNGPNGNVIDRVLEKVKLNATVINKPINGINPSHPSNPKLEESRQQLAQEILNTNSDIGIIWDGDCDRAYFLDNKGKIIPPEFVGILISKLIYKQGKMKQMTVDIRGSTAVEKELKSMGVDVKRIEAWHVPIKFEMSKDSSIGFGMETSGHYVFRDFYKIDDALLASLLFVQALEVEQTALDDLLNNFEQKYYIVEEINFTISKSEQEIVDKLKDTYKDGIINLIDGISVDYPEWRFNARSSRTEPIIRLNISGTNKLKVEEELKKIKYIIGQE